MSFSQTDELQSDSPIKIVKPATAFEKHILQCCKAPEWELRKWLKKVLTRAGFDQIIEDGYLSDRCAKESRYNTVHNMLAVRGNPNICLASHTDICRDHEDLRSEGKYSGYGEHSFWMQDRHEDAPAKRPLNKVEPVVKEIDTDSGIRRVIQDRDCKNQVGGDDRLGVAINTWIALNTGYDMAIYFPTDEETGLKSARMCEIPELLDYELVAQVDRGNHSNELVIKIGSEILCGYDTAVRLLNIGYKLGLPRTPVTGGPTDVYALKSRGKVREAVNMTCGYHSSYGSGPNEYICLEESRDTLRYVAAIVRDYYLNNQNAVR
jgi:hypothetical protein